MKMSFMAINRLLEEEMAENDNLQSVIKRQGKAMLSDGRELSDAQLVHKLADWGIPIDRASFEQMSRPFLSAQEMATELMKTCCSQIKKGSHDEDWLWIALVCLWERWFPDRPSFEMIDDQMQAGYRASADGDDAEACSAWLEVWRNILSIIDEQQMGGIDEFDDQFAGTQSIFNWLSDFEIALGNAGRDDLEFMRERISLCRTVIERFSGVDGLLVQNFKRALSESLRRVGNAADADALYSEWLRDDPQWGWGWIAWSDDHYLFAPEGQADGNRAVGLLRQGLLVPGVRDRGDMLERLVGVCEELGRTEEAEAAEMELRELDKRHARPWQTFDKPDLGASVPVDLAEPWPLSMETEVYEDDDLPLDAKSTRRVGRNEPCPCGSGKKYKKCCMPRSQ